MCNSTDSYSAEWAAVIVVHGMWSSYTYDELRALYLELSRARVYCTLIVYPGEGTTLERYKRVINVLNKCDALVHVYK